MTSLQLILITCRGQEDTILCGYIRKSSDKNQKQRYNQNLPLTCIFSDYTSTCFMTYCLINWGLTSWSKWTASSEFGTYRLCEQRRFRRACASAQARQNRRSSLIQAVSQKEPSDRKPDPWPLWMARHAQLKFVMTECSKTQIRLTGSNKVYWMKVTKIQYKYMFWKRIKSILILI